MKTSRQAIINQETKLVKFEAMDKFGRWIGAEIKTFEVDFVPTAEDSNCWYNQDPGHYFTVRTWATRNGNTYGPIQPYKYFKTPEERQIEIDKYLVSAQKRANKEVKCQQKTVQSSV